MRNASSNKVPDTDRKVPGNSIRQCRPDLPALTVAVIVLALRRRRRRESLTPRIGACTPALQGSPANPAHPWTSASTRVRRTRSFRSHAAGWLLHDPAGGMIVSYGPGLLAGYRHPVVDNAPYLAVEADVAFDNEAVDNQFQGIGESAGRNQPGERWPDRWMYVCDRNVGVSVRLGFSAGPLRAWNACFYALAGLRRIDGTFSTRFNRCLSPTPCSSGAHTPNFVSGTDSRDLDFQGSLFGIGFERRVRQRVAVRLELSHTQFDDQGRVAPFDDVGVTVPAHLSASASLPRFLNSCVGGPVYADGDGLRSRCDRDPGHGISTLYDPIAGGIDATAIRPLRPTREPALPPRTMRYRIRGVGTIKPPAQ